MDRGVEVQGEWRVRRRGRLKGGGSEGEIVTYLFLFLEGLSLLNSLID
jgi:hypothetical protein